MRFWRRKSRGEESAGEEEPQVEGEDLGDQSEPEFEDAPPKLRTSWRQVAVLIPCYNTGPAILDVVTDALQHAGLVLCIDDGSTDDTGLWIRKSGAEYIGWPRNRGKGHGLVAGFRYLWERPKWDILITMDGDGQHLADDMPYLIEAYEETGADIVLGSRDFAAPDVPLIRRWSNRRSSRWIGKKAGLPLSDFQSGYRLFTRNAVRLLTPRLSGGLFELETTMLILADRLGLRITETPITTVYNKATSRRSSWRAFRDSRRIYRAVKKTLRECAYFVGKP